MFDRDAHNGWVTSDQTIKIFFTFFDLIIPSMRTSNSQNGCQGLASQLVDLVWLNKASIQNFIALGSPEVAVSLLSRVGVEITRFKAKSQFKLD